MNTDDISFDPIKGKDNPRSLINITNSVLSKQIMCIPQEVLEMSESELEHHATPHDTERKLRAAFQMELERATRTEDTMLSVNIYRGIVSKPYWDKYILHNSYKLAYIIRPYPEYEAQLEDMLQLALDEMRKILKEPLKDKGGKFNVQLANLKTQIAEKLQDRRRGVVAQKLLVDQKSMNVNITKDVTETPPNMDAIEQRLKELEAEAAMPAITYKDVTGGKEEV